MAGLLERREEALHDDDVGDRLAGFARDDIAHALERGEKTASKSVEIVEADALDARAVSEEEARDGPVALDDEDDRDPVLSRQFHLDAHAERWNTGIGDHNSSSSAVGTIDA